MATGYYTALRNANPYGTLGVSPQVAARVNRSLGRAPLGAVKKPAAPAATSDPYAAATAGVDQIIAAALAQVEREQAEAKARAQAETQRQLQAGGALAAALEGLGLTGAIRSVFQNAANAQAGLAQGFSGQTRADAAAQAAEQQRQLAGSGQEGAVRNQGEAMGNVQYGVGGYIPASTFNTQAANYAAQAALEPGFALQYANIAAQNRMNDFMANELPAFEQKRLDVIGQRPQLMLDLIGKLGLGDQPDQPDLRPVRLADGRYSTFDPSTGRYSKPYGPAKQPGATTAAGYQAKELADGRFITFDPATGRTVGKPWGTPKQPGQSSAPKLQKGDVGRGRWAWFDPRTGKQVSPSYRKSSAPKAPKAAKQPRLDEGGRLFGRTDGVTATQARKYKAQAYQWAKAWHAHGGRVRDDESGAEFQVTPLELLSELVNGEGIPYDLAVRQLARWTPAARKWLKEGVNPLTGRSTRQPKGRRNVSAVVEAAGDGYNPRTGTVQLPARFTGTHVTDGLGWGTRTARDFMAPAGTTVDSPVSGTILYFHPEGAQGGGSMMIVGDDGYEYWLGHIQDGLAGGRVEAGQPIARVAFQNVSAPHVHVDRRPYQGRV